jgi:hypothetical protein
MNTSILLEKLFDIERSVGVENTFTVRNKIIDAENYVFRMQRDGAENVRSYSTKVGLRQLVQHIYRA